MGISPYIEQLRRSIGTSLLLVPCVAVLPRDRDGWLLLVRHIDSGLWGTIGGAIEPDEAPESAARREAREEAAVEVELRSILTVAGGPRYRVTYLNGDEVSCVVVAYDAAVCAGSPAPDHDETSEVRWFAPAEINPLELNGLNRQLLHDTGLLGGR